MTTYANRPAQVSPTAYSATLKWSLLLGGDTEQIGPYRTNAELRARLRGILNGYPGAMQPSVEIHYGYGGPSR